MKKPAVTIIIPVYNREWCIKRSIDSVLNQTFQDFEIIIVNDGSTDNTSMILNEYANINNVEVIKQKNQGVSKARNTGIKHSNGEYISFLDSDDLWEKEKLQIQIDFFNQNKNCMVCQTEETWIRNNKKINPKFRHKKPSGDIFIPSLSLCLVSPSAVMMKKSFFKHVGLFDTSMPACEDYDLWLRSSLLFKFGLIDVQAVIKHGGHEDQLSTLPLLDKYRIYSIVKILDTFTLDADKKDATIKKLEEKCKILMNGCLKRKKWEEALIYKSISSYWKKKNESDSIHITWKQK